MTLDDIARIAHEVNRAYCESIGDPVPAPWAEASAAQRASCVDGVRFHLKHPDASPAASHENWLREKERAGWTWGPLKSEEARQHPCMRPFEELPPEQRTKDFLFRGVVHALREHHDPEPV